MANPIGARKNACFKAVSTAPSINKTPVGAATPPLPYPVFQDLSNSTGIVPSVRFNGDPAYVLDQTTQPSCKGDDPGTAGGVKSGTVNGEEAVKEFPTPFHDPKIPPADQAEARGDQNGLRRHGPESISAQPTRPK